MRKSLLELAKEHPTQNVRAAGPKDEELELALAVLSGSITAAQAAAALGIMQQRSTSILSAIIWKAAKAGQVAITSTDKGE